MTIVEGQNAITLIDLLSRGRTVFLGSSISILGMLPMPRTVDNAPIAAKAGNGTCAVIGDSKLYLAAMASSHDDRDLSAEEAAELRLLIANKTATPKISIKRLPISS